MARFGHFRRNDLPPCRTTLIIKGMARANAHVVIVEDDPDLRRLAQEILAEELAANGPRISQTESGQAALTLCREEPVDVLVLDLHMPGLSGLDVLRQLPTLTDPPYVVAWSADTFALHDAEALGARLAVRKGGDMVELADAVRIGLARRPRRNKQG